MLSNIMDKLYYGDYFLREKIVPEDTEHVRLSREYADLIEVIRAKFSETEYNLLEKVLDLNAMIEDYQNKDYFQIGVSFGLLLMKEAEEKIRLLDVAE